MPDILLDEGQRFAGDFALRPDGSYTPTPEEKPYLDRLTVLLDRIAAQAARDEVEVRNASVLRDLTDLRAEIVREIRLDAAEFVARTAGTDRNTAALKLRDRTFFFEGVLKDRGEGLRRRPFEVVGVPAPNSNGQPRPLADIDIQTFDVNITDEQQRFKVDVDKTLTTIKVVLSDRRSPRWRRLLPAWVLRLLRIDPNRDAAAEDAARRLDQYLFALLGIARVGLMNVNPTQAPFAGLALRGLRDEFVAREAGLVKNSYILRLGFWALLTTLLCVAGFFLAGQLDAQSVPHRFRRFFLLAAGAAVGTWLSFSLRRPTLGFDDLAALEEDRLSPGIRILFVVLLTTVVGLLFWTQAITVEIGRFSSNFHINGAFALLIGALSGIAERGLATAVTKRAQEFVAGVGGRVQT